MAHDGHEHEHHHHQGNPVVEHRSSAPISVSMYLVTCSDSRDSTRDESGAAMRRLAEDAGHTVAGQSVIRDDAAALNAEIEKAIDSGARAIVISGGTGLSKRDITVETVEALFEKTIGGFGELFRHVSFDHIGTAAMLSRACAGTYKSAVIFALPGSPKAVELALSNLILPELGHLVRELSR